MSLWGTLAKVAVGYATARGVDHLARNSGAAAQGGDALTQMLGQLTGGKGAGGLNMQDLMGQLTSGKGFDLSALMGGGGGAAAPAGGLLSTATQGGGAGMAGLLSMLTGAAGMGGQNLGNMIDQFAGSAPQEAEDTAALMLRAMIQSAKADGQIDADEQAKILETLGDDTDPADIAFVKEQLAAPIDIAGLANDTSAALAPQVYAMSLMPIRLDTQAEASYLSDLAQALGLAAPAVSALHAQMGVRAL